MKRFISTFFFYSTFLLGCKAAAGPDSNHQKELPHQNRERAILLLEEKISQNESGNMAQTLVLAGEERRLNGNGVKAKVWFNRVIEQHPNDPLKAAALIGLTLVDAETSTGGNIIGRLKLYAVDPSLPDTMRADLNRILSLHLTSSSPEASVYYGKQAWKHGAKDPSTLKRLQRDLATNPSAIKSSPETEKATMAEEEAVNEKRQEAALAIQEIKTQLSNKQFELVVELCDQFKAAHPESIHLEKIDALQDRAEAKDPFHRRKIGVLLPISHPKYSPMAKEYKQTIEFAAKQMAEPLELIFFDSKGEGSTAKEGVKKLVVEDGVSLILGPILKTSVFDAALAAQAYEVPMLTLSRTNNPLAAGEYIFFINMDNESQIEALLDHAMSEAGVKRFVALAPDTKIGRMNVAYFKQAVQQRGGRFIRAQFYDKGQKDFTKQARLLGGKPPTSLGPKKEKNLKPIVDFDAIFLPDNYRRTPLVASALAFQGFAVGGFKPAKGSKPIKMLGLSQWNNPKILRTSSNYLRKAVFVDSFWSENDTELTQEFTSKFQQELRRKPQNKNAVIYDAMTLIADALSDGIDSRKLVREGLMRIELPESLTNGKGFDDKRHFQRELLILELGSDAIKKWVSPEDRQ